MYTEGIDMHRGDYLDFATYCIVFFPSLTEEIILVCGICAVSRAGKREIVMRRKAAIICFQIITHVDDKISAILSSKEDIK
jgi:hypothetical protein